MTFQTEILVCVALVLGSAYHLVRGTARSPRDVADDLTEMQEMGVGSSRAPSRGRRFERPVIGGVVFIILGALLYGTIGGLSMLPLFSFLAVGLGSAYLWNEGRRRRLLEAVERRCNFHLPLVMEGIVMAVEAGADVLGAIRRVVETPAAVHGAATEDSVTELLRQVLDRVDRGGGLEDTLREVAAESKVISIRHAFLHLALAHREGGELIKPLRELGNSTQLFFQESVEEEIAKLPVKATAPLICTFTGLVICFITVPLLQVSSMTKGAVSSSKAPPLVDDRGVLTLFLAFIILPVCFLLATLALDLRAATFDNAVRQQRLDDAVLLGVRDLPRAEEAREQTLRYLERFDLASGAEVEATGNSVEVMYRGVNTLFFPRLLGVAGDVSYTLYARARSRPVDGVIALDLSRYLAPASSGGSDWGDIGEWGAARYFDELSGRYTPPRDPRRLTARCFNPIVSALKLGAIRAHNYLSAFGDSRIGVGIFPGDGVEFELVRSFGGSELVRVVEPRYVDEMITAADCADAALEEEWYSHYRFPVNRFAGSMSGTGEPSPSVGRAVWMSPVRAQTPITSGIGEIGAVIEGIFTTLLGAPDVGERGGFAPHARRLGIIFSGDLPWSQGERFPSPPVQEKLHAVLSLYRELLIDRRARIAIYLVILPGLDTTVEPDERMLLTELLGSYRVDTAEAAFQITPIFASEGAGVLDSVLPMILLDRSGGGIAR
ncbi:MAG: hypothetical protein RL417_893 [Pseudomonadota bacterium]|jgi:hypothetical protein